jgi:hypothetical protein
MVLPVFYADLTCMQGMELELRTCTEGASTLEADITQLKAEVRKVAIFGLIHRINIVTRSPRRRAPIE